jgi:hypothetical protein
MKLHVGVCCVLCAAAVGVIVLFMTNQPQIPSRTTESFEDAQEVVELNVAWRKMLGYFQKHPEKAEPFLSTVKNMFFDEKCTFKQPRINFANLADNYSLVFK